MSEPYRAPSHESEADGDPGLDRGRVLLLTVITIVLIDFGKVAR